MKLFKRAPKRGLDAEIIENLKSQLKTRDEIIENRDAAIGHYERLVALKSLIIASYERDFVTQREEIERLQLVADRYNGIIARMTGNA